MILDDVGQYLDDNALGTLGTDLFLSQMPDSPDDLVTVYEYAGNPAARMADNRSPGIQIRARAVTYADARTKIESVYALLDAVGNEYNDATSEGVTINSTLYLRFQAVQEPFPIGVDDNGRHELAQNFIATYAS